MTQINVQITLVLSSPLESEQVSKSLRCDSVHYQWSVQCTCVQCCVHLGTAQCITCAMPHRHPVSY